MLVISFSEYKDSPHMVFGLALEDFEFNWCSDRIVAEVNSDSDTYIKSMIYEDKPNGDIKVEKHDVSFLKRCVESKFLSIQMKNHFHGCDLVSALVKEGISFTYEVSGIITLDEDSSRAREFLENYIKTTDLGNFNLEYTSQGTVYDKLLKVLRIII